MSLRKAADRLLAPASLQANAMLSLVVKDAFFDFHTGRQSCVDA
jgi:hypothetical protein